MTNELNPQATPDGIVTGRRMIGYSSVIQSLDSGRYDRNTCTGLRMLACIQDAKAAGWLTLSVDKEIIIWRWLVVTVFINEELEKNGTVDVPNDEGGIDPAVIYSGKNGAISVYAAPERFALANHVEGCAVEKYGVDIGQQLALRMYQDMVTADTRQGFRLSAMGREGFEILHDSFIEEIQTNGMPDMPVMH